MRAASAPIKAVLVAGAIALITLSCSFEPESGNTLAEGPAELVDPYRSALLTAADIDEITGITFTSVDSVELSELETCGRSPLEDHPPDAQVAKGFASEGDNLVVETIQIFEAGEADRYLDTFEAGVAECGSYSDGRTTVNAESFGFAPVADRTLAYRLTGPDESPQNFSGVVTFSRVGDDVVSVTVANVEGEPIPDADIEKLVSTAVARVADV